MGFFTTGEEFRYLCDCAGGEVPVDAEVKQWSEDWDAAGAIPPPSQMHTRFFSLFSESSL